MAKTFAEAKSICGMKKKRTKKKLLKKVQKRKADFGFYLLYLSMKWTSLKKTNKIGL